MKAATTTTALQNYLAKFPNNAKTWDLATDEIRDIARTAKEYINEYDNKNIEAHNFKAITTPQAWNTTGKAYILNIYALMSAEAQRNFNEYLTANYNITTK